MIRALVQREPALRWIPASCALAALLALVLVPVLAELPAPPIEGVGGLGTGGGVRFGGRIARMPFSLAYAIALMVGVQATAVASTRFLPIRIRVREFERALPLTTRDAVAARMIVTWASLVAPLCTVVLVLATRPVDGLWFVPGYGALAAACAVSVMFAYRPTRAALGVVETVGVVLVGLGVLAASAAAPAVPFAIAAALVTVAALASVAVRTGTRATADDPGPTRPSDAAHPADLGVRLFGPLRWTLLRSTALRPQTLVFFALAAIAPAAFAGGNRALLIWIAVMAGTTALRLGLQSLHGLGGLPLRRERVLRYAALPSLAVLVASATAAALIPRPHTGLEPFSRVVAIERGSDDTLTGRGAYHEHLRVPPTHWRVGAREDAVVTAPWGESAEVLAHPLWPGAGLVAFNPYDVDMTSSARFLEWQLARALRAVHGDRPAPDVVAREWIAAAESADGLHDANTGLPARITLDRLQSGDSTEHGYALEPWRAAARRGGFAALEVTLLWLLVCAFLLRPNVPDARGRTWRRVLQSDGFGVALVVVAALTVVVLEAGDRALVPVVEATASQWIDARLGGAAWAWIALDLAVAAAGYALLRWRIGRIEVPPLALNGWTKKPVAIF